MMTSNIDRLGVETIQVWRFYRTFKVVSRVWHRLFWRSATRAIYVIRLASGTTLADRRTLRCVDCGSPLRWPRVPSAAYTCASLGCARCQAYYFLDASGGLHETRYNTLRRELQERG